MFYTLKRQKNRIGFMVQTIEWFDEKGNKCESCTIPLLCLRSQFPMPLTEFSVEKAEYGDDA